MGWMPEEKKTEKSIKELWELVPGIEMLTVAEGAPRKLTLMTGHNDKTNTWLGPHAPWVHEYKNVKGQFITTFCTKFKSFCVECFENEIYKQKYPNYRSIGGRLPKGLSKKGFVPVYDHKHQKITYLLAGKSIQDGISFVMDQQGDAFKGDILITRSGKGLNTSYRVDAATLNAEEQQAVDSAVVKPRDEVLSMTRLNDEAYKNKTGIDRAMYFAATVPQHPYIDISDWGETPDAISSQVSPTQEELAAPAAATQQMLPLITPQSIEEALSVECTQGLFAGSKMKTAVKQGGKPFFQYLASQDLPENTTAQYILDRWDEAVETVAAT